MSEYNKELVEKVIKGMMKFRKFHHPKLSDDISRMEGSIIFWLVKSEKMENKSVNVSELAEGLHVSMQSISRTLKSLENKGYIVREVDSDNRRNTLIKLSKKGNELVEKKKKDVEGYFERVFSLKRYSSIKEVYIFEFSGKILCSYTWRRQDIKKRKGELRWDFLKISRGICQWYLQ